MENRKRKRTKSVETTSMAEFGLINEDLLHNILKRLPATSFSSASCVSKTWNSVCNRILSRPKLCSALSLSPSVEVRLEEVVNKVLSEPFRPQFVIANTFGDMCTMRRAALYLAEKLGWNIPIVVSSNGGIMGRDVATSEFKEVVDTFDEDGFESREGISLTVGFFPGVTVRAIPLEWMTMESPDSTVERFVTKIQEFSVSVSGSKSPMAVIMFGNPNYHLVDLKSTMERLDYTMSKETVIVGDEKAWFIFRTGTEKRGFCEDVVNCYDAVALVFARDRRKSPGVGEIQFSAALSSGVSSIGPVYKAASVKVRGDNQTWLTAKREGLQEILDGERMLSDINDELEDHNYYDDLYIGVTKRRKSLLGSYKSRPTTFLSFHSVHGGDHEYLYVDGPGIRTGDYFQFYCPHRETALTSCSNMSSKLRKWKLDCNCENSFCASGSAANYDKKECIGGFIFSCSGRTKPFLGCNNADSSIFLENFPGVPLAGVFCGGEIGRGISMLDENEGQEASRTKSCHVYSCVCLIVSYTPVHLEN